MKDKNLFEIVYKSRKKGSLARLGTIHTAHGSFATPAFVPVATKGSLKSLTSESIRSLGIQVSFVNTYHLATHPGASVIAHAGGIHSYAHLYYTLMSDSGGFQVFSLARGKRAAKVHGEEEPLVVKMDEDGVTFRSVYDGGLILFTPESSMQYQTLIGADINMAFDECTYYPADEAYTRAAMERTHHWLNRCIAYRAKNTHQEYKQFLYGVIQGGSYENLRRVSARYVCNQSCDGLAIGGVSVGESKREMYDQVRWVSPFLDERPVHLLGIGHVEDIYSLVGFGIDTFDCVEPTRLARLGILLELSPKCDDVEIAVRKVDITKSIYKEDLSVASDMEKSPIHSYTKSYLHHLFRQREILGYTLASAHNLYVMQEAMRRVRRLILEDKL
jgi:tRNA-guanine transglycosylase